MREERRDGGRKKIEERRERSGEKAGRIINTHSMGVFREYLITIGHRCSAQHLWVMTHVISDFL